MRYVWFESWFGTTVNRLVKKFSLLRGCNRGGRSYTSTGLYRVFVTGLYEYFGIVA